jgi:type I restriction enzyme M protein
LSEKTNATSGIISKVWSFCNTLRDDGVGYGDYLEQLTYLLFLKMADEFSRPPYNRKLPIPEEYAWENLTSKRGSELEVHYATLLRELSRTKGILGQIFTKSQNKIQDPAKLFKLIDMIDKEQWTVMGAADDAGRRRELRPHGLQLLSQSPGRSDRPGGQVGNTPRML